MVRLLELLTSPVLPWVSSGVVLAAWLLMFLRKFGLVGSRLERLPSPHSNFKVELTMLLVAAWLVSFQLSHRLLLNSTNKPLAPNSPKDTCHGPACVSLHREPVTSPRFPGIISHARKLDFTVNSPTTVFATASRSRSGEVFFNERNQPSTPTPVRLSQRVKIVLISKSDSATITALSQITESSQLIPKIGPAVWAWEVLPLTAGNLELHLFAYSLVNVGGAIEEESILVKTINATVQDLALVEKVKNESMNLAGALYQGMTTPLSAALSAVIVTMVGALWHMARKDRKGPPPSFLDS